jgi:SAM-dependent methyltransferase
MNRDYWDRISKNYQREVLSVFDNDIRGLVAEKIAIAAVAYPSGRAADLGCGVGRFTPLLCDSFELVDACDYTSVGLKKAKARCRSRGNVDFHVVDLANDSPPFDPVEFALCVNVLIMPAHAARMNAWRTVVGQVCEGGTLALVVPSFESAQMEYYHAIEERLDEGENCASAIRNSIDEQASAADMRMGILRLDNVRTKHYLKDEIEQNLRNYDFEIIETCKVEYPPEGDASYRNWDWLVVARKT